MSFFGELKRRNVVRVGIAYVVIGWALAQVAEFAVDNFDAPEWTLQIFVVFLLLGLPLVLFFAWAFEITPEGLKREKDVDRSQSITAQTGRKLDFIVIGVLVIAVGFLLADKFYLAGGDASSDEIVAMKRQSIAVLPFVNMSDDADHFADGLSEELLNLLAKNPDLRVIGRTSSFAFKGRNEDLREIGEALGVVHVLEGSVRRSGDRLRVTAQLIKVDDASHLWSETYNREMADIFDIQDDVAGAIADELNIRLVPPSGRPTDNIDAYASYLEALALLSAGNVGYDEILSRLDHVLALDPEFAKAYELEAYIHWFTPGSPEVALRVNQAATAALEFDQSLVGARAMSLVSKPDSWSWGIEFDEIEDAVQAAPNDFNILHTYCYDLLMVGYRDESLECSRRMIELEPLSATAYWRAGLALSASGMRKEARESWQHAADLGVPEYLGFIAVDYIVAGEYDAGLQILQGMPEAYAWTPANARQVIEGATNAQTGKEFLDRWIREAVANSADFIEANLAYQWYFVFGYLDEYWAVIEKYESETDSAWTRGDALEMRGVEDPMSRYVQHPNYVINGAKWGMTELWDKRGPPDMCNKDTGAWVCE
jgi:TolB-like protein